MSYGNTLVPLLVLYTGYNAGILLMQTCFFSESEDLPDSIRNNLEYFPYFQDCIEALDGYHVSAIVAPHHAVLFRN